MTPERTVHLLAELLAADAPADEEALVAPLAEAGVTEEEALRAIRFTQLAWGRELLEALDVQLSQDYLCFDAEGAVLEEGRLAEEPYYRAAAAEAESQRETEHFARFAASSSDVQAVYGALAEGLPPSELRTGPCAIFVEPPNEEGIAHAQQELERRIPEPAAAAPRKPWWRPW